MKYDVNKRLKTGKIFWKFNLDDFQVVFLNLKWEKFQLC